MTTLLLPGAEVTLDGCDERDGDLWLPIQSLPATGWELKPEGACRGDVCVPLPSGRDAAFLDGGRFNFTALARHLGMPFATHAATGAWAFGESSAKRNAELESLVAPEFSLPDLDGREHRLSDYRGRKVFMVTWASW